MDKNDLDNKIMKRTLHIFVAMIVAALSYGSAFAQGTTSPYSKIGYGLLSDNASSIQRSMGGVGYAMQNGRTINAMNPASYSQVDSLTFLWDMGIDLTNLWSSENGVKAHSFGGGLDYITAEFKMAKHLGGSFGLIPFSSVGYTFGSTLEGGSEYRSGSGGINQLYLGAGYEPLKGLSVGANVSYMFGTTVNNNTITVTGGQITLFQRVMEVRDWNLQLGVQYARNINAADRVVVGATYQPKKSFHGHTWGTYYDSQDTQFDSIGYTSLSGKYEQPHSLGVGVSYTHRNRLQVELDYTYQDWSGAKYAPLEGFEVSTLQFDKRWKVAAGMQYCANRRTSYWGMASYRLGAYFNHDYINITGNNVRDYGVSAGIGLPVPNGKTTINLGFEWKHRYAAPVSLIKEDYFNITVGVNFNESWFWKNKIR